MDTTFVRLIISANMLLIGLKCLSNTTLVTVSFVCDLK